MIIDDELFEAINKFPPFASPHEGYAIIKEEVDELWDDIKANKGKETEEIIQVAAMAVRYILDLQRMSKGLHGSDRKDEPQYPDDLRTKGQAPAGWEWEPETSGEDPGLQYARPKQDLDKTGHDHLCMTIRRRASRLGHSEPLCNCGAETVSSDVKLRRAIRSALDELGVPQSGYPAPVANAVDILTTALEQS